KAARRLQGGALQPRHGSPAPRARIALPRRCARNRRRARQARAMRLPRQQRGTTPHVIGRYPTFDVFSQPSHWDEVTGRVGVADAPEDVQAGIVHRFSKADLHGGVWDTVNIARAFKVVMRYVVQAFYAHPWAWNEIGFGGPAYPRGYGAFGSPHLREEESWEAK